MQAAIEGDVKKAKQELEKPETLINAQDSFGKTALYYAAQENRPDIIQELLKNKKIDIRLELPFFAAQ